MLAGCEHSQPKKVQHPGSYPPGGGGIVVWWCPGMSRGAHWIGILGWECHLPATLHPGSPASQVPQQAPRCGLILPFHAFPPQAPLHSLHTQRQKHITKSAFIKGWVGDRNRGHWGPYPDWQRGSGVGSHPASSKGTSK